MISTSTTTDPAAPAEDDSPVDAAFFDLILETDLANIIKKAQTGQPLTKREREMIEEERTRRAKIAAPASFQLEGEGPIPALDRMTQRELAEVWGYSTRQIKNWLHDGRANNDPAPVTQPELMCSWFQRIYAPRDAPEKLRRAVTRILEGHRPQVDSQQEKKPMGGTPAEVPDEEKGLIAMLDRYRTAEVRLHNAYMEAVEKGDESRSQFLLSEWSKMGEKVRALEKSAPKALEELRIYVRRDEVQRELMELHGSILKGFRQEFRMARVKLRGAQTQEDWNAAVDETVDRVAKMLVETEFREPLELDAA